MTDKTIFEHFDNERQYAAAKLESIACKLSILLDSHTEGVRPGEWKINLTNKMMPYRKAIFRAQEIAYNLRKPIEIDSESVMGLFDSVFAGYCSSSLDADPIPSIFNIFLEIKKADELFWLIASGLVAWMTNRA